MYMLELVQFDEEAAKRILRVRLAKRGSLYGQGIDGAEGIRGTLSKEKKEYGI